MGIQDKFVATHLPEHIHRMLLSMATEAGMRPDDMASRLLSEAIDTELERRSVDGEMQVDQRILLFQSRTRRILIMRSLLMATAQNLVQNPDENMLDEFELLCEAAGFIPQELLSDAERSMNMAVGTTVLLDEDDTTGKAIRFLVDTFKTMGTNSLSVRMLEIRAEAAGLRSGQLRQAKSRLGLLSVRHGRSWFWELQSISADFSPVSVR